MSTVDDLVAVMNETLAGHYARVKDAPITIPARKLALAVEAYLTGGRQIPAVPVYVAELAEKLRWSGLTVDPLLHVPAAIGADTEEGAVFLTVVPDADLSEEAPEVDEDAPPVKIELLPTDARAFALHVLSVADQAEKDDE